MNPIKTNIVVLYGVRLSATTKHGHFKVSAIFILDTYWTPTLAQYFLIHIGYTETMSNFKNPKTYLLEPCPLSKVIEIKCRSISLSNGHSDHTLGTMKL